MRPRHCELCNAAATVFCPSDAAFLCRSCDANVHDANFLVARHVRQSVCSSCTNPIGKRITAAGRHPPRTICNSCSEEQRYVAVSSGNSSDCISSTTSPAKGRRDGISCQGFDSSSNRKHQRGGESRRRVDFSKAEGIIVNWCVKLGVGSEVAVGMACRGLRACTERWTVLPFRVCLVASMWLALRLSGDKAVSTWQVLKRLEELSGVPAKVILAAEMKLERGLRVGRRLQGRRLELEEGWAEC